MATDTFTGIVGEVTSIARAADIGAARIWVRNAFRRLNEKRIWSWLVKREQVVLPASYTTGTVTVTADSTTVTGSGTTWTVDMQGRQFRVGDGAIHEVTKVNSTTSLEIYPAWGGSTASAQSYEISQIYITVPDDFLGWISVVDFTNNSRRLKLHYDQRKLDKRDPQRTSSGTPALLSGVNYTTIAAGKVFGLIQVRGSGQKPTAAGTYSGFNEAIFTLEITTANIAAASVTSITSSGTTATVTQTGHGYSTGDYVTIIGAAPTEYTGTYAVTVTGANTYTYTFAGSATSPATGTITARREAVFKWKKNEGTYTTNVVADTDVGVTLSEGVAISFPSGTYVVGDTFCVRVSPVMNAGLPRFEVWPHVTTRTVLQFQYISRYKDIDQPGVGLPGILANRGDILVELALAEAARWPGTETMPNPYAQIARAEYHEKLAKELIADLERQDEEIFARNIFDYNDTLVDTDSDWPDLQWRQEHDDDYGWAYR